MNVCRCHSVGSLRAQQCETVKDLPPQTMTNDAGELFYPASPHDAYVASRLSDAVPLCFARWPWVGVQPSMCLCGPQCLLRAADGSTRCG